MKKHDGPQTGSAFNNVHDEAFTLAWEERFIPALEWCDRELCLAKHDCKDSNPLDETTEKCNHDKRFSQFRRAKWAREDAVRIEMWRKFMNKRRD